MEKHEECYVHNIFIILSQQILGDRLLFVVTSGQKNNLSCEIWIRINNNLLCIICYENVMKIL